MATQLEELKQRVDDAVKRQKSGEIDLTVLEAMLKNKRNVLIDLEEAVKNQGLLIKDLEKDFAAKNKEREADLSKRSEETREREARSKTELEAILRQKSVLEQEKSNAINQQIDAKNVVNEYREKVLVIQNLISKLNDAIK